MLCLASNLKRPHLAGNRPQTTRLQADRMLRLGNYRSRRDSQASTGGEGKGGEDVRAWREKIEKLKKEMEDYCGACMYKGAMCLPALTVSDGAGSMFMRRGTR